MQQYNKSQQSWPTLTQLPVRGKAEPTLNEAKVETEIGTHNPILAVPPYNVNVIKDIHTDLDASYPESLAQSKPFHTIGWLRSTVWVLLAKSGSQPLPP